MSSHAQTDQLVVLFLSDIERSTEHWRERPEDMPDALRRLDLMVESAVRPHDGEVVKSRGEGDSHFVVFRRASSAVRAAAALQRAVGAAESSTEPGVRVRIAIHAGEVHARDGDYYGVAVNYAARLRSTAHGGQVVVSRAVVEVAAEPLRDELEFATLGRHGIRDIPGWTEVFQLCGAGLMRDFPPLVTLDTGLPPVATIVLLDAVAMTRASAELSGKEHSAMHGRLFECFSTNFETCGGQYLKQLGDGCLALFADPDAAMAFVRGARSDAERLALALRSVVHLGRVEFAHEEPVGRPLQHAAKLIRRGSPDRIGITAVTAALIGEQPDTEILD